MNIELEELNKIIEQVEEISINWKYKKHSVEVSELLEAIEQEDWTKLQTQLNEISDYNFNKDKIELEEKIEDLLDNEIDLKDKINELDFKIEKLEAIIEELEFKIEDLTEGK